MTRSATPFGVGSLPFTDAQLAAEHVREFYQPLPFVPQPPLRGVRSQMVAEPFQRFGHLLDDAHAGTIKKGALDELIALSALPPAEQLRWQTEQGNPSDFDESLAAVRHAFMMPAFAASKLKAVKAQLVGPGTLFKHLTYGGRPAVEQLSSGSALFSLYLRELELRLAALRELSETQLFVLDEPALPFLPRKELYPAITLIGRAAELIRDSGARFGLHCCASLDDEGVASALGQLPLDLLSIPCPLGGMPRPLGGMLDRVNSALIERVLGSGGTLALGICPTDKTLQSFEPELAAAALRPLAARLELRSFFLSASCGLAFTGEAGAQFVGQALRRLQQLLAS